MFTGAKETEMIGKIIGAAAGAQASKYTRSLGGTSGAVLGAVAVPVVRRLRIPALLALAGGGYLAKKLIDKDQGKGGTAKPNPPA
jgi:hypothetical protein